MTVAKPANMTQSGCATIRSSSHFHNPRFRNRNERFIQCQCLQREGLLQLIGGGIKTLPNPAR